MKIRKIRIDDITKVIDLINRNYDEVMIGVHSKNVIERLKSHNTFENWENQMKWKRIFVVEDNTGVIATGALANFGDSTSAKYCISNFFVEPENQYKGIGRLLLNHIFQIAEENKINHLHVPTSRTGQDFYKKMGFLIDSVQNDTADEITWMTRINYKII